jgi:hypothetical protein
VLNLERQPQNPGSNNESGAPFASQYFLEQSRCDISPRECNSQKGEKPADDFLRRLYREGQLNAAELAARLRALDDLASGKLRPSLPS